MILVRESPDLGTSKWVGEASFVVCSNDGEHKIGATQCQYAISGAKCIGIQ